MNTSIPKETSACRTALDAPPVPKSKACVGGVWINCNKDSLKPRISVLYPVRMEPERVCSIYTELTAPISLASSLI